VDMSHWIWGLFSIGVGVFATICGILYGRQGVAYIPTRWIFGPLDLGGEWVIARDDHPIFFWIVIVALLLIGGLFVYYGTHLLVRVET